jgi:hypothetical protein
MVSSFIVCLSQLFYEELEKEAKMISLMSAEDMAETDLSSNLIYGFLRCELVGDVQKPTRPTLIRPCQNVEERNSTI